MNAKNVLLVTVALTACLAACDEPPAPKAPPPPPAMTATPAPATGTPPSDLPQKPKADTPTGAAPQAAPEAASPAVATNIKATFEKSFPSFKHCYDEALQRDGTLKGQVLVKMLIRPDGVPVDIKDAGSSLKEKGMIDCVTMEVSKIKFPQFDGKAVTYAQPLDFSRLKRRGCPSAERSTPGDAPQRLRASSFSLVWRPREVSLGRSPRPTERWGRRTGWSPSPARRS